MHKIEQKTTRSGIKLTVIQEISEHIIETVTVSTDSRLPQSGDDEPAFVRFVKRNNQNDITSFGIETQCWFECGKLHRTGKPAIVEFNIQSGHSEREIWCENNQIIKIVEFSSNGRKLRERYYNHHTSPNGSTYVAYNEFGEPVVEVCNGPRTSSEGLLSDRRLKPTMLDASQLLLGRGKKRQQRVREAL